MLVDSTLSAILVARKQIIEHENLKIIQNFHGEISVEQEYCFQHHIELKFREETFEMLHLVYSNELC
jgi:hypothetical protein